MLISAAYAASEASATAVGTQPEAWEAFAWNMGLVLVLVVLFYVLLILPQQKRFKEHKAMLDSLKKGDEIVTGGGLIGKIEKVVNENEVIVNLGNDLKVTALRSTVQTRGSILAPVETKGGKDSREKESKETKETKVTKKRGK